MAKIAYQVNRGCTFCATCLYECPAGAIHMGPGGAVIDREQCTGCGRCSEHCASEAISRVAWEPESEVRKEPT